MRENRLRVQCSILLWKNFTQARPASQCKEKLQVNNMFASAKARLFALHCRETTYNETFQAPRPRLGLSPSWPMALHYGKTICNETIVSPLVEPWKVSTYLLGSLVASHRCANQQRCLQGKKVHGVLRDAIRCIRA